MPPPSPPHIATPPTKSVIVSSGQNINPLTIEDLKKILHQTTLQSEMCTSPILVSVEELQRVVAKITKEKVNPQEPPSQILAAISAQPTKKVDKDTTTKVDASTSPPATETVKDQTGQTDTFVSTAQPQVSLLNIKIIDQGRI